MERTVEVDGKEYRLVTNGFTPIAYKREFGRDYFGDMMNMFEGQSLMQMMNMAQTEGTVEASQLDINLLKNFDMTFFHRLFWTFAKSGNPQTASFEQFFMEMESFPYDEVSPILMEMLEANMKTKKNSMTASQLAMKSSQ